jgi:hypothetical protein
MKRLSILIVVLAAFAVGCSSTGGVDTVTRFISKDIALEDQDMLMEKYIGQVAWTREVLEDLNERETPGEPKKKVAPRDTKIEIFDLNFSRNGAITVVDVRRRKITHGLEIERPLSVEKIEEKINEILWFDDPTMRHVEYIRKWDKRTARAVRNHEVFIGMPAEAALESWGTPTKVNRSEIGGKDEQQWVYKEQRKSRYIYIIGDIVTKWDD